VSTYAYVNPVVAILLGSIIADEPLGTIELISAAIIIASVVLITSSKSLAPRKTSPIPLTPGED
jgi:drug/metabolite transporter (DMT)-like permease